MPRLHRFRPLPRQWRSGVLCHLWWYWRGGHLGHVDCGGAVIPVVATRTKSSSRGRSARRDDITVVTWNQLTSRDGLAGAVWRWRIEAVLLVALALCWGLLVQSIGTWPALAVVVTVLALVLGLPWSRRFVVARFWCLVTRHRIGVVFAEIRAVNRAGHRPAIVRVKPTPVGERVTLWCRPGISVEDFEDRTEDLASACWARQVQVSRHRHYAHVVTVEVSRRDPLAAAENVSPKLMDRLSSVPGKEAKTGD